MIPDRPPPTADELSAWKANAWPAWSNTRARWPATVGILLAIIWRLFVAWSHDREITEAANGIASIVASMKAAGIQPDALQAPAGLEIDFTDNTIGITVTPETLARSAISTWDCRSLIRATPFSGTWMAILVSSEHPYVLDDEDLSPRATREACSSGATAIRWTYRTQEIGGRLFVVSRRRFTGPDIDD